MGAAGRTPGSTVIGSEAMGIKTESQGHPDERPAGSRPGRTRRTTVRPVTGIEITPASVEKVEALAPLWKAMVDHHRQLAGPHLTVRASDEAWAMRRTDYRRWLDDGTGVLLVATVGDSAVPEGYAFLRIVPSGPTFDLGPRRGEVESLVVAPRARGAGVGTALLQEARRELRRRGCTHWSVSVMEANASAAALYERVGFRAWLRQLAAPLDPADADR